MQSKEKLNVSNFFQESLIQMMMAVERKDFL